MRAALIATMILLLPAALFASGPSAGVYFEYRAHMTYSPHAQEVFTGYLYANNADCYLDGFEFGLSLPPGITVTGHTIPVGALEIGTLPEDLSIGYFPPLNGFYPGYNLLCTIEFTASENWCAWYGGTLVDAPLSVVAGTEGEILGGDCWPDNIEVDYTGLTSILCPDQVGTSTKSWGAIKSLF